MSIKNIVSKILGLDRKERSEPVEPTTIQAQTDPSPPLISRSSLPSASVSKDSALRTPNSALTDDAPITNDKSQAQPPPISSPPPILPSSHLGKIDFRNPATNREPRGKVAHLPPAIRHLVCEWISDGVTLEQIARNLADLGHPGFNHKNISNWKENGYRTWCQHQQRHERARLRAEDTMSFATEHTCSDALVAAAEIDASNALEDANIAYDPNADHDSQLKQTKIILNRTRSLTLLNSQRQRSRKLTFQEQCHRDKLEASKKPLPETAAPETEEERRKAFFDEVDKLLGIKTPRDQTCKATQPILETVHPQDDGTRAIQLASARDRQVCEELAAAPIPTAAPPSSPHPEAERPNVPGTQTSLRTQNPPSRLSSDPSILPSSPLEPSGSLWNVPAAPQAAPVTSRTPLKTQSPRPAYKEDWERLLTGPTATPNFIPQPEPLPKPYAPNAKPLKELPTPALGSPYPPAPLAQPEDKLALCNHNGVITDWIGKSEDPSKTKPWIQPIKNHLTRQIICWLDFHSRPPGMTDADAVRGQPHFIPVFDTMGRITNWVPEPNGRHKRPPTLTTIALESDHPRIHFAWLELAA